MSTTNKPQLYRAALSSGVVARQMSVFCPSTIRARIFWPAAGGEALGRVAGAGDGMLSAFGMLSTFGAFATKVGRDAGGTVDEAMGGNTGCGTGAERWR